VNSASTLSSIHEYLNIAPFATISTTSSFVNNSNEPYKLIDRHPTTSFIWDNAHPFHIELKLPSQLKLLPLSSYSLVALNQPSRNPSYCYSWSLYGYDSKRASYALLDKHVSYPLSQQPNQPSYFQVQSSSSYSSYIFVFAPDRSPANQNRHTGLSEIQLFTSSSPSK